MLRHIPNALTASRLVLAAIFFALLSYYQYEDQGGVWLLHLAFIIYVIALVTDFLDGYLARRWNVEGAFGRVVDPFVDKVLVLGSFIFFAGKNFTIPHPPDPDAIPSNVQTITGVVPWMVVLLLGRELLITSFRGSSEGSGQNFGARFSGKVKMAAQSVTILVILLYVNYRAFLTRDHLDGYAMAFRDICIWVTLLTTLVSGTLYLRRVSGFGNRHSVAAIY